MTKKSQVRTAVGAAAVCLLLSGCIPVKNLEKAWGEGEADSQLAGQWVGTSDSSDRVAFVATDQGYQITSSTSGLEGGAKTITAGEHSYLMVVQLSAAVLGFEQVDDDMKSGNLVRYAVDGDELTIYQYEQEALGQAIESEAVPGEALEDEAPTLLELDEKTLEWLASVGDKDAGWSATGYQRATG